MRVQWRWIHSTLGAFLEPIGERGDQVVYMCEQYSNDTELLQINLLTEPAQVHLMTVSLLSNQRTLLSGFGEVMASRRI